MSTPHSIGSQAKHGGTGVAAAAFAPPRASTSQAGAAVQMRGIRHRFAAVPVIEDVTLEVAAGELVALLGPSGCGKSTLLRILAGLQVQSEGEVHIGGQRVDGLAPRQRGVGIVFQNYALFPHMTVAANVAYGLEANGAARRDAAHKAMQMLEMVRMDALAKRYPRELSGGQQQRVALARTLAVEPRILLLDEPFAALDKNLRLDMQIEIRRLQRELNITTVMVTHDQEEAMSMADRVAVLNRGRLEQYDTSVAIYDQPATSFVATFVGTANLLPVTLRLDGNQCLAEFADGAVLSVPQPGPWRDPGAALLAVRPEQWEWQLPQPGANARQLLATVQLAMPIGPTLVVDLQTDAGQPVKISLPRAEGAALQPRLRVALDFKPDARVRTFSAPTHGAAGV
ncbi:ABC transporter ATP-binding protein [Paraburkholderia sp. UCT31]|uniref:ABC transporter ATP-binding protein n=1 Tax=Paraburkholderia sp. UCT31 TaxID=2615209 RepID=UPI00223A95FD|nr:ABC transporter ATP-binding protein [Paraburkholderia sp. UCT31]